MLLWRALRNIGGNIGREACNELINLLLPLRHSFTRFAALGPWSADSNPLRDKFGALLFEPIP